MDKHILGSTGLPVSKFCLGTMTWGEQNTEAEGHEQMDYAISEGINFFDVAELYPTPPAKETQGRTEEIIGTWFAARKNRDKIILATKMTGPGYPWIRGGAALSAAQVRIAVDSSLKRLQTDYIDLYQLHWPNRPFPHFDRHWAGAIDFTKTDTQAEVAGQLDVLRALGDLVKQGKIRHIGLSDDTAWGIMSYLALATQHNLPRMATIQNEFSLLRRTDDPYVAEVCVRENIAYLPWSPLGGGVLTGKYLGGARPAGSRWAIDKRKAFRDTPTTEKAVLAYKEIAEAHGLDLAQMALAFCAQQSFVTSTIIGATSMAQLRTNIEAARLVLSPDVMKAIDAVQRIYPRPY